MLKIFLINLDRSPGRLAFMQEQFRRLNLEVERVPAVDGSAIDLAPYKDCGLTPGEIGCFLSHRQIWNDISVSGYEYALVLEDDVKIGPRLPNLISDLSWVPQEADIIKLDTSGKRIGTSRKKYAAPFGVDIYRIYTSHLGTAAYIVGRETANKLLAKSASFSEPVDHFLFGVGAFSSGEKIFQTIPAVAAQAKRFDAKLPTDLDSLIKPERVAQRVGGWRRILRNLLRPFGQILEAVYRLYRRFAEDIRFTRVKFEAE